MDLSICKDIKITISLPVNIDENELYKYDPKNSYYNDLCNTYTTEKGTDLTLTDRKNEFIENNMTLCEETCEYKGYNTNTKKADCECPIKINLFKISQINVDKDKLYDKFKDIKNIMNLNLMKCYKLIFTKNGIIYNIGSYIVLCVIILYFISIIIFYKKDLNIIKKDIEQIILIKNIMEKEDQNIKNKPNKNHNKKYYRKNKDKKVKKIKRKFFKRKNRVVKGNSNEIKLFN